MKKTMQAGMIGLMIAAAGCPSATQAGQREWATAGKILTGVFIGGLLTERVAPRPVYREVVYERPVHYRTVTVTRTVVVPRESPCEPLWVTERVNPQPVIRYLNDGRRLFQPPVHGHSAYVQVWSEVSHEWVSIQECASIW